MVIRVPSISIFLRAEPGPESVPSSLVFPVIAGRAVFGWITEPGGSWEGSNVMTIG